MAGFHRPRFKNHQPFIKSNPNRRKIKVSKTSSKVENNSSHGSTTSNTNSQQELSLSPRINKGKQTKSLKTRTSDNANSTLRKKAGRRFFFFSKKSKVRLKSPNTIATDNAMLTISHYTTDTDNVMSDEGTTDGNWKNEPLHLGMVVSSRQGSEESTLTTTSRRISLSNSHSEGNAFSPQQKGETSELTIASRRSSSSSTHSTKLTEGEGSQLSSSGSVISSQSDESEKCKALHRIFNLKETLCAIQDNSFHSTVTDEPPRCSMHGNDERGKENLNSVQESLEMQLLQRTAAIEENQINVPPPLLNSPPPSNSHIATKLSPKSRSFLAPAPKGKLSLRIVSPEPEAPDQSKPQPLTRMRSDSDSDSDIDSFRLIPMNKDLSLEDTLSASVLPADLSMDLESIALEMPHEGIDPRQSIGNATHDVLNAELRHIRGSSSRPIIIPADISVNLDSFHQEKHHGKNVLCDIPHEVNDELRRVNIISRPTTASSGCRTMSSRSSSEDVGHMIRSRMLDGSDFDSNYDSNSETHSLEKESAIKAIPYQSLDDTAMEDRSQSSTDSSYHFVNLPLELQSDHVAMDIDDESNRGSEVATTSSDDDTRLKDIYSNPFGVEEEEWFALFHSASPNEEESDLPSDTRSMLGLFKDDESCNSSKGEDFEDDEFDDQSKACCSISMHDITTIHEENEDDIAEEVNLPPKEDGVLPINQNLPAVPHNGDLHLGISIRSQGTGDTGTISSMTDDSYMGRMSFDSSSVPEGGYDPRELYHKITGLKDGQTLDKPSYKKSVNDESSLVSFADSAWSLEASSYDSFSSKLVNYMVDILKDEAKRRRSKIKERIAKIRETTDKVNHINEYVSSRLLKERTRIVH